MSCRGLCANSSQTVLYAVHGNKLYRVARNGARTQLGTLLTRHGYVDMRVGTEQLVIVDGPNLYTYALQSGAFAVVVSAGWLGSTRLGYVKGSFLFSDPNTGVFYISALEDAANLDPLDFATAPSKPDNIVAAIDNHGDAWLLGTISTEVWPYTGRDPDFPLEQNEGANMQTGLLAAFTAQPIDNTLMWLGRDESGAGQVFKAEGFTPKRVSNEAVEQTIQSVIEAGQDITKAIAYTYQQNGRSFYVLYVPGLDTSWTYDANSDQWHERAEFVNGDYAPHRAAFHAYCYGKHILGTLTDNVLYSYNPARNNNAGDILVRDRVSPHYAQPTMERIVFGEFELDCTVGKGKALGAEARVMMRYSDDGGETWSDWRTETLGAIGETRARARFTRNGSSLDRVWHVRCVDDVPFAIVKAKVKGR